MGKHPRRINCNKTWHDAYYEDALTKKVTATNKALAYPERHESWTQDIDPQLEMFLLILRQFGDHYLSETIIKASSASHAIPNNGWISKKLRNQFQIIRSKHDNVSLRKCYYLTKRYELILSDPTQLVY